MDIEALEPLLDNIAYAEVTKAGALGFATHTRMWTAHKSAHNALVTNKNAAVGAIGSVVRACADLHWFSEVDFLQLQRVQQMLVEYLLYVQEHLHARNVSLEQMLGSSQAQMAEQAEYIGVLEDQLRRRRLETDHAVASGSLSQCPICLKAFSSGSYLDAHLRRRHPAEAASISASLPPRREPRKPTHIGRAGEEAGGRALQAYGAHTAAFPRDGDLEAEIQNEVKAEVKAVLERELSSQLRETLQSTLAEELQHECTFQPSSAPPASFSSLGSGGDGLSREGGDHLYVQTEALKRQMGELQAELLQQQKAMEKRVEQAAKQAAIEAQASAAVVAREAATQAAAEVGSRVAAEARLAARHESALAVQEVAKTVELSTREGRRRGEGQSNLGELVDEDEGERQASARSDVGTGPEVLQRLAASEESVRVELERRDLAVRKQESRLEALAAQQREWQEDQGRKLEVERAKQLRDLQLATQRQQEMAAAAQQATAAKQVEMDRALQALHSRCSMCNAIWMRHAMRHAMRFEPMPLPNCASLPRRPT